MIVKTITAVLAIMACCIQADIVWGSGGAEPAELRCEYLENPMGIDSRVPRLSWKLETRNSKAERGIRQTAYRILVASSEKLLENGKGDLWDSGKVENDETIGIDYKGKTLESRMRYFWKVLVWTTAGSCRSKPAFWEMGLLKPDDPSSPGCAAAGWKGSWIVLDPRAGSGTFPLFRKTFVLDEVPGESRAYITSLGYHELYINGAKVGDDVLSPAVAQMSARSWYLTHAASRYLRKGTNCIAVHLGRGWYFKGYMDYENVQRTGGRPAVMVQLEIRMPGGQNVSVVTDESWKGRPSPCTQATRWGLRYDARQEQPGWNRAGFDDSSWKPVEVCGAGMPGPCAQMVEPNRIVRVLPPVKIEAKENNSWMVDFGTNVAGWCTLKLHDSKEAGKTIVLNYGDDPRCDQDRDEYITSGKGEECFQPRLSYQAFRFVRISGLNQAPEPEDVSASLIRTDYATGSSFACSNPRIAAVHDMVSYTFQCLTLGGYMVDCPHIERLGYGGDGQASSESAMMIHRMDPLYRNWMTAWRDCQSPDGDMPHTAPIEFAGGGPYWCGFIIAVPWQMYVQYGDKRALEENYGAMQKWLGFVEQYCKNGDIQEPWPNNDRRNWYLGDWALPDGINQQDPAAIKLVANCYRVYCYDLMTRIAEVLERKDDAVRYRAKANGLRPIVHQVLYDSASRTYARGTQLDLAFPLLTGIVPQDIRADVIRQLEQDILVKRNGHLGVGLVGVPILVKTLIALDRSDLVFSMVNQETYPGWGHMIKNGATTTWEHWNGNRSRIHNCYNGIGMWFYQGLGGIRPELSSPAYKRFVIKPAVAGDATWVRTRLDSVRGVIASDWNKNGNRLVMSIVVPPNTAATVHVPAQNEAGVTESGKPLARAKGVRFVRMENGAAVCEVASGNYRFQSSLPETAKQ